MSPALGPVELDLDTRWMRRAACRSVPGLPWIEDLSRVPRVLVGVMAEVCDACPVRAACAEFVDQGRITAGWWAGASRSDRDVHSYEPAGLARLTHRGEDVEGAA